MSTYCYLMRMRPPGPGAVPKDGLRMVDYDEVDKDGTHYWGHAYYGRELTKEEMDKYEMDFNWMVK